MMTMHMTLRAVLLVTALVCHASSAQAQNPGSADPGWTIAPSYTSSTASSRWDALAVQPDGKVIAAGQGRTEGGSFVVYRFEHSGTLDPTFGTFGSARLQFGPMADVDDVIVDAAGRIYVAGSYHEFVRDTYSSAEVSGLAVVRFLGDGTRDISYGSGGAVKVPTDVIRNFASTYPDPPAKQLFSIVPATVIDIVLQPDGKLVLLSYGRLMQDMAGQAAALVRFDASGRLDNTFASNGVALINPAGVDAPVAMDVMSDGSLVIISGDARPYPRKAAINVTKLTVDGLLDTSFGSEGLSHLESEDYLSGYYPGAIAVQDDDRIVIGGSHAFGGVSLEEVVLVRLNANGGLDDSFGSSGFVFEDISRSQESVAGLALQTDGKILVAGTGNRLSLDTIQPFLFRVDANGQRDTDFLVTSLPSAHYGVTDIALGDGAYLLTYNFSNSSGSDRNMSAVRKFITSGTALERYSAVSSRAVPVDSEFSVVVRNPDDTPAVLPSSTDRVALSGFIFPQAADANALGDIYLVVATPSGWYMRDTSGRFLPWSGSLTSLLPSWRGMPLGSLMPVSVYNGTLALAGTYRVYLGYQRTDSGELIYMAMPYVVEVRASP